MFFDVDKYIQFVKDARDIGIDCPILPGIFPIVSYDNFKRIQKLCNVSVPEWILKNLEDIKEDETKVVTFGIEVATDMCKRLYDNVIKSFHFYTLNKTYSVEQVILSLEKYVHQKEP